MSDQTKDQAAPKLQIEKVFTVAVEPARAWEVFADGDERAKWEATTYEIDPVPGGAFR